jgi:hypothetical protein
MAQSRPLKAIIKGAVPLGVLNALRALRTRAQEARQRRFDRRYHVATAGPLPVRDMDVDPEKRKSGTAYQPTPRSVFLRMLKSVDLAYHDDTFVDIGSGKGAVLLYASGFPFRQILGIEYSPKLHQVAESNIRRYSHPDMRCRCLAAVCTDAVEYPLPDGPLVLYLHNPFGEDVMSRLIRNIEASLRGNPREVIVLSYNPAVEATLDRVSWLVLLRTGWNYAIYRTRPPAPTT